MIEIRIFVMSCMFFRPLPLSQTVTLSRIPSVICGVFMDSRRCGDIIHPVKVGGGMTKITMCLLEEVFIALGRLVCVKHGV